MKKERSTANTPNRNGFLRRFRKKRKLKNTSKNPTNKARSIQLKLGFIC
jgi:hypothetical protein